MNSRDRFHFAVGNFVEQSYDQHKNYGHAAGYLESMLCGTFEYLPPAVVKRLTQQLLDEAAQMQRFTDNEWIHGGA